MKEIILTSSVMILVLIVLRAVFRSKVSRLLIYGMWLLVALRLLIPVQFGSFRFSILNRTEPVTQAITEIAQNPVSGPSREEVYQKVVKDYIVQGQPVFVPEVQIKVEQQLSQGKQSADEIYEQVMQEHAGENIVLPDLQQQIEVDVNDSITAPTIGQVALIVWIIGMAGMAGWFLGINVSLHRSLKRTAKAISIPGCAVPVKVDETLTSPCLFGIFKPTIYLTPACAADTPARRHVLAHELTHLQHKDHIWALVRCLCLCVFWFNPLVWVAASLSKRDCELACDESVLKKLGDEERIAYGKTLVDMVAHSVSPSRFLETATAMHETKEQLKERVNCIVKKPKIILTAVICVILVAAVVTGCAFTGAYDQHTDSGSTSPSDATGSSEVTIPGDTTGPSDSTDAPTPEFAYSISDAWYYPADKNVGVSQVHVIRSVAELTAYTGKNASELDPKHNDSFFKENTLIIAAGLAGCDPYAVTVENAVMLDNDTLQVEFGVYVTEIVSDVCTSHSVVIEVNRVLNKNQVQYTWQDHIVTLEEYNALSPSTGPQESKSAAAPVIPANTTLCDKPDALYYLVSTVFNRTFVWNSRESEYQTRISIPAIVPFCDGAIAINESIRQTYQYRVDDIRNDYENNWSASFKSIWYGTYLHGDLLTICITTDHYTDLVYTSVWTLNISTGKQVSTAELAKQHLGESYPAFLQHCTYNLIEYYKANPWGNADDQAALLKTLTYDTWVMSDYALYWDNGGNLMLTFHVYDTDKTFNLPYNDMDIYGFEGTDADGYHWLFHLTTDGAYADEWSTLLMKSFFYAPEEFVRMLSKEDETVIRHVADCIDYALYTAEEIASYTALCESIRDLSGNKQHSETAQLLLDAVLQEENISSFPIAVDNSTLQQLKDMTASYDSWYARAATSFYADAKDINLCDALRDAFATYKSFTDAELTFLKNTRLGNDIGTLDIVKIPAAEIDSILQQYFGITLAQSNKVGTGSMVYFDDTDCYYCVSNDVASVPLAIHSAYRTGYGTIAMYYDRESLAGEPDYVMILKPTDSGYQILSNQRNTAE